VRSSRRQHPPLAAALHRYVEARSAALIDARRTLRVNELDARALLFIADRPGTRPGTLRDYLGITSAGVTTLIDRLVERGAVRRDIDPDDRRVNRITATVDLADEPWSALTRFDDALARAMSDDDPTDTERFAEKLDALISTAAATAVR
jgi:DNA-binding MarR family transcriptional regulator